MGCDIHVYVEHSRAGKHWMALTDNAGHRNYRMFGIMAGVRCEELKLFDPKGLPDGAMSFTTECAHWRNIAPDAHPEWANSDGYVSRESAEKWVKDGYSTPDYQDGVLKRVSDPDHHSHSWLTAEELARCVNLYKEISEEQKAPTEWVAILAAMQAIEGNGDLARVIFWFDN